ncbi:hypothetical protein C7U77_20540 [Escherichia coli]|nr:hypothetical protein C7U77_20540 [Escherichia coli]
MNYRAWGMCVTSNVLVMFSSFEIFDVIGVIPIWSWRRKVKCRTRWDAVSYKKKTLRIRRDFSRAEDCVYD